MKKIILVSISMVFLLFACNKDFETINTNPNDPTQVDPEFLLRQVIYNIGEEMSYEGFVAGNLLSQHFTMVDFNLFDRHALTDPQLGGNPWPVIYKNLRDVELILDITEGNQDFQKYKGPARILKGYLLMLLTDIYGDAPAFEAASGQSGVVAPGYDSQQDIYLKEGGIETQFIEGVKDCQAGLSGAGRDLDGDILYDGDLAKWISFSNTLLLKMYIRIGGVQLKATEIFDLINQDDFIDDNSKNATFDFTDLQPNSFRMQQLRDGDFNLYVMSETMEEIMTELDDPRVERFFRPNGTGTEYAGLLNGPDASATSITVSDYSFAGEIFRENTGELDANFMRQEDISLLTPRYITI